MSNTSTDKSPKSKSDSRRLIIDEIGRDTQTGILGRGYSSDNGKTFHVLDTIYGRLYGANDINAIWNNGTSDRVKKEVDAATAEIPAVKSAADEAVKKADSAIASSKVNSDAIVAQSEAISEAKAAMERATAEIQQTATNAASDAAKIRADVARVQNEVDTAKAANQDSVNALQSDIDAAKKDLADARSGLLKAKAAVEQNKKLINDSVAKINNDIAQNRKDLATTSDQLTSAQKSIADNRQALDSSITDINNKIAQDRKDVAAAQQANADMAKKLNSYTNQAIEQGKTIEKLQTDDNSTKLTIADIKGNVSQVQDSVNGLTANLKDANNNLAAVKALADSLSATLTDHGKNIASLQATAKELSSTLSDADGRLSKVEQTAKTQSTTLSTVQGNLSQVKQEADSLTASLKDTQGNIAKVQTTAKGLSEQITTAQGDITALQTDVSGIKATIADHDKNIHTLQADSKTLKDDMADAKGNISSLQKTATSLDSEFKDHDGRLSKVEQTATSNSSTILNLSNKAMLDRGSITDSKASFDNLTQPGTYSIKATGLANMPEAHYGTLIVSGSNDSGWISQQFVADTSGTIYTRIFANNAWSDWKQGGTQEAINQVKQTADANTATISDAKGDINSLKQTAKTLNSSMTDAQGRLSRVEQTASTLTNEFSDEQGHLNRVEQTAQGTQQTVANQQGQINNIKTDAAGIHETLTGQGNQIANINVTLSGLNSKYDGVSGDLSKLSDKVTTNSTQIDQDKKLIALKADQTTVDNLSDEVSQNKAQFTVQAGQISSKVSSIETSLANANSRLDSITSNGGGRNLLVGTGTVSGDVANGDGILVKGAFNGYDAVKTNTAWHERMINLKSALGRTNAKAGDWYTISVYIKADKQIDTSTLDVYRAIGSDWGSSLYSIRMQTKPITTQWQQYSWSFQIDDNSLQQQNTRVEYNSDTGDNWIYWAGWMLEKGTVAHDWSPAPEDTDAKITANSTAIDQTNKEISLKADQTEVDKIKETASYNSSRLDVMNNEIKSKVSSTDVNNIVDGKGYATQSTVQSLITQKAGKINETITNLTNSFNSLQVGGRNYLRDSDKSIAGWAQDLGTLPNEVLNSLAGKTITVSVDVEWENFTRDSSKQNRLGFEAAVTGSDGKDNWLGAWKWPSTPSGKERISTQYSLPAGVTFTVNNNGNNGYVSINGSGKVSHVKIEIGNRMTDWTPAPEDMATVMQIQQVTATVDGLTSTVANKADTSQITQLSNLIQSKVSSNDFTSKISQLSNDINARVSKGDLMSQINIEAGRLLFQSNKIFLDADTIVFSKNSKAFIPDAAIENLSLDKLTTGHLNIPLQDKHGNSISLNNKGITVASPGASEKASEFSHMLFNLGNGKLSLEGDLHKISSGETEHYRLGSFQATYDYLDKIGSKVDDGGKYIQQSLGMSFVIDTLDPGQTADKNGDFFALARSQYNSSNPAYVNGVLYNTTGNRREIGLHTFDPLYIHPYGADGYIQSTWVSWSNWNNGEKMPALTQAGITWGGIGFPKNGKVTLFDSDGHAFQPYGGSNYDDYQKQYHIGG